MLRERNGRTNLDRLGYMHGADSVRCQREKNETICGVNEKSVMAAFLSVMFFFWCVVGGDDFTQLDRRHDLQRGGGASLLRFWTPQQTFKSSHCERKMSARDEWH